MNSIVIIGAGHAGFQCAAALRQHGFDGGITLVSDDASLPYQRPPLSKAYLLGKAAAADLHFRPATYFEQQRVRLVPGEVEQIDRAAQRIVLRSGESMAYDHLVLATGSQARGLAVSGANLEGVFSLQTLGHADRLRQHLQFGQRAVVIGAGFIGLEFAAAARTLGLHVAVVDTAGRALSRAASTESAGAVVAAHERHGATFHFGRGIAALRGADGKLTSVVTIDGETLRADVVLVGIGSQPRTRLAEQAGLQVDNGVCVDAQLCTIDPSISAIGDVASFPDRWSGKHIRLESVQNATDQARSVALRLTGKPVPPSNVPWFWSDQGDLKLQIAGLRAETDEHIVLTDVSTRAHTVLCLRDGMLAAVETIDRPVDHMLARRLLAEGVQLSAAQARAPGFTLKALARSV